ncbi:MAG TPA: gamma-glutamylcyclotransferase family protein [Isosphaeraceae bacterium]|nr:gamma-glutamylcyclotransferase family protein [Isosphaeraceae bacterium]
MAPDLLFAYGTLGPSSDEEARRGGWVADAVRGRLFDLGPYPGLVDCGVESAGWVEGHVRRVELRELVERLDPYEGVEEGLYRRIVARTRGGRAAWVYEFAGRLPADARGPLRRWRGRDDEYPS